MIGRVYKIIHNQSSICYIGSTSNKLKFRWRGHKSNYKKVAEGNKHFNCSIYKYFKKYGVENFKIILIKEYDVYDNKHLKAYEQLWINKLNCINECPAWGITKLTMKLWKSNNRNKLKMINKKSREKNIVAIKEKSKETYFCEKCKETLNKAHKARHEKTKKHQTNF